MTWGNRNPQPKEKKMNTLDKMIDYAIAKARNEGFAEGVKWQQATDTRQREQRGEAPLVDDKPVDYMTMATGVALAAIHKENDKEKECLLSCECRDEDTGPLYYIDTHRVTKEEYDQEKFQPDDRYQDYNDAVWPGEVEDGAEEGDGE